MRFIGTYVFGEKSHMSIYMRGLIYMTSMQDISQIYLQRKTLYMKYMPDRCDT